MGEWEVADVDQNRGVQSLSVSADCLDNDWWLLAAHREGAQDYGDEANPIPMKTIQSARKAVPIAPMIGQ